jgi:hypothetical protein
MRRVTDGYFLAVTLYVAACWRLEETPMTNRGSLRSCAVAALSAALACGHNDSQTTNLKPVFFRTVANAPVATFTLQRHDGSALTQGKVMLDTRPLFDGWLRVGRTTTANANGSGVAATALTAGTYPLTVTANVPPATALVGQLLDSMTIAQDTAKTYQTSQQSWTVTSPKAFSALQVLVYQVDGNGRAMVGDTSAPLDPLALSIAPPVTGGNATQVTFSTELFKGSYRAVITATPVASTDSIAPFETPAFAAAGGGANETQTVALASGGNVVSLHFTEAGAQLPDSQIGSVDVFDADSYLPLGSAGSSSGVATVSTGAVTNVIAIVAAHDGATLAAAAYAASPTHTATLTRYTVGGHAKTTSGAALTQVNGGSYGTMAATLKTSLGSYWDGQSAPVNADISDALGTYQIKLFAGSWSLQAVGLQNLPSSAAVQANVSADVPSQDVALDPGGVIAGNIQDQAHNNIQGVQVSVVDANHLQVARATTDASGNYSVAVPLGSYELYADGALTRGVAVSPGATTKTLNLTRFQITGRLTDATQGAVAGKVYWGGGNVTASALGTFTLDVVEGQNWFLFAAPSTSPSLGFAYETNVLVNADTVKTLQ